jgi:hypothetical protein
LLGDGSIEKRKRNPRLRIDHAAIHKAYVFWKYNVLKDIATREPHSLQELDKRSGKIGMRWYFGTHAMPELDFYYRLFYEQSRKVIRPELKKYFQNPLSLAVWIMDDGYKRNDCDAVRLSTDCFSYTEQLILKQCLSENFGIDATVHKKGDTWNIYIPSSAMAKLRAILAPHIVPVMRYKLMPRNDLVRRVSDRIAALKLL